MEERTTRIRRNRFLGIYSYQRDDAPFFFGRDKEIEKFFYFILEETLVLLFARLGIGKTSFLNAGVIPALEQKGFYCLSIRLNKKGQDDTPLSIVDDSFKPFCNLTSIRNSQVEGDPKLWELLKASTFPSNRIPVLIFDQFEEFFSYNEKDQYQFLEQINELVHDYVPNRINKWYSAIPIDDRTIEDAEWCLQPRVKAIIAIRSDKLFEMNSVGKVISRILANRFELLPLSEENARKAIVATSENKEETFNSPPFVFKSSVLNAMITKLSGPSGIIETIRLQMICSEIESKVIQTSQHANYVVSELDIEGIGGLENILNFFYENQMSKLGNEETKQIARNLLEEHLYDKEKKARKFLLEGEVRMILEKSFELAPSELINKLLDLRLLTQDFKDGNRFYEISHDALLDPISKSSALRNAEEEKRLLEKANREKQERLNKELKLKRRIQLLGSLFIAFLVVAILVFMTQTNKFKNQKTAYQKLAASLYITKAKEHLRNYDNYHAYQNLIYAKNTGGEDLNAVDSLLTFLQFNILSGVNIKKLDDRLISSLTRDSTLYIWDVIARPFALMDSFRVYGPHGFSRSGKRLAFGDKDHDLEIWNLETNKMIGQIEHVIHPKDVSIFPRLSKEQKDSVRGYALDYIYQVSEKGNVIIGSYSHNIKIYILKDSNYVEYKLDDSKLNPATRYPTIVISKEEDKLLLLPRGIFEGNKENNFYIFDLVDSKKTKLIPNGHFLNPLTFSDTLFYYKPNDSVYLYDINNELAKGVGVIAMDKLNQSSHSSYYSYKLEGDYLLLIRALKASVEVSIVSLKSHTLLLSVTNMYLYSASFPVLKSGMMYSDSSYNIRYVNFIRKSNEVLEKLINILNSEGAPFDQKYFGFVDDNSYFFYDRNSIYIKQLQKKKILKKIPAEPGRNYEAIGFDFFISSPIETFDMREEKDVKLISANKLNQDSLKKYFEK